LFILAVGPKLSSLMLGGGIRPAHRYGLPMFFFNAYKIPVDQVLCPSAAGR